MGSINNKERYRQMIETARIMAKDITRQQIMKEVIEPLVDQTIETAKDFSKSKGWGEFSNWDLFLGKLIERMPLSEEDKMRIVGDIYEGIVSEQEEIQNR